MGALVGGVYAAGKLEAFHDWVKGIDKKRMLELIDFSLSINHLAKGDRIIEAIMEFVPDVAIEDLPIPYCAVATDLTSGREVLFNKGSLFKAIRASITLPTFYKPVERDGMVLIDGGVINPIPLNRVKRQEGDIMVGVDVNVHDFKSQWEEMHKSPEPKKDDTSLKTKILDMITPDDINLNYYTVLSRASRMMIHQNSILMAELMKPDILVDIQMDKYGVFDFYKSEKIVALGKRNMSQAINEYESRG
jgi:NTE family protein